VSDTETENPHAKTVLMAAAAMQRATLLVTPPAIVVSVVVFLVIKGMPGLVGGLIGGALGLLSSLATLAMMRFSAGQDPMFSMVIALGGYIFKILVLFGALTLLKGIAIVNPLALGVTLLVAVIISAAAEVRAQKRAKIPTIIPAGS
jgi:F0F1-type ATP synthase assembly protein I